ncbi:osteoclast-stimulating factor 1 [Aspergillus lentulus]|uniref:ankyrin repeat domain-containing protein n=1 Tax=Aspergillus lentulus TaxID=293939 RepID=UPI001394E2B2|nr:osteoclast-stimulating factor 1 [Aspergillus lentulus]GFF56661.1 osteoclast-stimulating factor 1 [Aspergillus lentulus]GFF80812.1 osteoclast-stimulating factor 1 [Aspergillus lentulus]
MDVAMRLLACGERLDINTQTYQKESALSLAAHSGHLQVVSAILEDCQADRNSIDKQGRTALWWAAHEGQSTIMRWLLEDAKVQLNIEDCQGRDALEAARSQYHFDVIRLLQTSRAGHHRDVTLQT